MTQTNQGRRQFIRNLTLSTAVIPISLSSPSHANAQVADGFTFEVIRTDAEWRDRLTESEYTILRNGGTEQPRSSPLWNEVRDGLYSCKGCDLTLFDGYWKTVLDIGWVFFRQSEPHAILTAIDRIPYQDLLAGRETTIAPELTVEEIRALDTLAGVEAQCRRCGSHLGHIISVNNGVLYCINGTALDYVPT